ncbi:MAG: DUF1566 domain-containing protein [Nitrospinaceae bacterium]|nr:DUF1566 domain-containing protein [Nitrospina sp.]MBT5375450.1 DUF1566 domain-containing protein [Nitrospinaceae bacterium]MBT5868842.1 DUF1566 domain-containing protein [Nitrospinaceae bacterium]MBT6345497.1 DUF1566 domain-containing protein [Nitrospina sp.]
MNIKTVFMVLTFLLYAHSSWAEREPYEAPAWVAPPPPTSRVHLIDNADGTLTETKTQLMWTQQDSYSELGKCLNWYQAQSYVKNLKTGGYTDWRLPKVVEYGMIYDDTKENILAWDHDPDQPLGLSKQFADGAAYWYWSAEFDDNDLADCCARVAYFVTGRAFWRNLSNCTHGGVRAVRDLKPRP